MSTDATFWDGIAESYAAKPVDDPDAFERKIAFTRELIAPDSVVLGIGCGTGSLALRLAPHAGEVHGLDVSPEMIRIARDKAEVAGADNVTFHVGPFDDSFTAIPDGSLDVALAFSILHLLDDRTAALAQLYRLLRPGGTLVASTVCLGRSRFLYAPMIAMMRLFGKAPRIVAMVHKEQLLEEMRGAGFVDVREIDVGAASNIAFTVGRRLSR